MPGPPLAPRKVTGHGGQSPEQSRARFMPRPSRASGATGKASFRLRLGSTWFDATWRASFHSYLTSTVAPASSNFFLIVSASSLETPSLTVAGARLDQVLGLLEAEAGDFADGLDDVDLLVAGGLEDDVELGLLLDRRGGAPPPAAGAAAASRPPRRRRRSAPRAP